MSKVTGEAHIPLGMSVVLYVGGALGYTKSKSVPSLIAGITFGTGFVAAGYLISKGEGKQGHGLGLGLASILTLAMGARYSRSKKLMPAGIVAGTSGLATAYHGVKLTQWW
eukprot:maker-scaffold_7-snap-gene-12.35-mRNA-1 protein AED:0.03 eAED:0.03 QI:80/0/0.5/1/1/1/2/91/110